MRPNTWIVVPLYNEAGVVRETVEKLLLLGGRIVVVDDGSTDGDTEAIDGLDVVLLRHPFNLGQGAALCTGFKYALSQGSEYVATFDSDGQYLATDLVGMQDYLVENDLEIVTGSRFLGRTVGMPELRRLLVRASRWLARVLYGIRLTDTQNGVRMMNRRAASMMLFTQNRMAHAMEAHARVARYRLRHAEYPNTMIYTEYSRSKGQGNIVGSLRILCDLFMPTLFRKRTFALQRQVTALARQLALAKPQMMGCEHSPATREDTDDRFDRTQDHPDDADAALAAAAGVRPR
jgi:polyprenyl-phospho-N-acetylgalactosaminyl synthase